jgi:hypothetical protein
LILWSLGQLLKRLLERLHSPESGLLSEEPLLTHDLHRELIATRIRVMEIDPGQVETEFSVVRFYGDKAKADAVYA